MDSLVELTKSFNNEQLYQYVKVCALVVMYIPLTGLVLTIHLQGIDDYAVFCLRYLVI